MKKPSDSPARSRSREQAERDPAEPDRKGEAHSRREVILLKDLAPRADVKGGVVKIPFGQRTQLPRGPASGAGGRPKGPRS